MSKETTEEETAMLKALGSAFGMADDEIENEIARMEATERVMDYLTSLSHNALHLFYAGDIADAAQAQAEVLALLQSIPSDVLVLVTEQLLLVRAEAQHKGN
jgi:hypothetical protein